MVLLLERDLLPMIPSEGSVGASGDLTPLSYLAAVLCGEGEVWRDGATMPAARRWPRPASHRCAAAERRRWRS